MIFKCFLFLQSVLFLENVVSGTGQKIIFEDEISSTISSSAKNEFNGESRSVESASDLNSLSVNSSSDLSSSPPLISKQQFYPPQPGYPPPPPFQFNSQFPSSGDNPSWQWNPSITTTNTQQQQQRKPSFVQFPGETYPVNTAPGASQQSTYDAYTFSSSGHSHSSSGNSGRSSATSSGIRIDDKCHCGLLPLEKDNKLQRIVGGNAVKNDNSYPWMVAVTFVLINTIKTNYPINYLFNPPAS